MELKEYIKVFRQYAWTFFAVVLGVCVVAAAWVFFRPVSYDTTLSLHIARSAATQQSPEYNYDDFYRLQADERFADTVVRWLATPRIVTDILHSADMPSADSLHALTTRFHASRLSSQFIEVTFSTKDSKSALALARAISDVLNEKTRQLNGGSQQGGWFEVVVDEPSTYKHVIDWKKFSVAVVLVGVFLGFWVVLLRNYMQEDK